MENFSGKYLKSNLISRRLINNFYESAGDIISKIDAKKILEVGCGPGFSTQYLLKFLHNKDFEASELDTALIKEAKNRNPGVKIQQESVYELKRNSDSFDLVVALEVLEHLDYPELALKELRRVSSKYCLISVPDEPLWRILNICRLKYLKNWGNTPGHLHHWSKSKLTELVKPYFKIAEIKKSLPWLIILAQKNI